MRIIKDNYMNRINDKIAPIASAVLIMCAVLMLSGVLLAIFSAPGEVPGLLFTFGGLGLSLVAISQGDRWLSLSRWLSRLDYKQAGAAGEKKNTGAVEKYPTKKQIVYLGTNLNTNGMTPLGGAVPFPFGDGYDTMFLDIYINLTVGTGTGAISEGELLFIKNIYMKTDKHGAIIDNVCGRALFRRAQKLNSTSAYKDAIAAASAVYVVSLPINFSNPRMRRKQDTLLDMKDVGSLDLQITLGSVSDLLTTPGTATVSVTADIAVQKTIGAVTDGKNGTTDIAPRFQPYIAPINPWDPNVQQNIELPKTKDLAILDLMILTTNGATGGVPCSGTPTANVVKRFTFEDNVKKIIDQMTVTQIKNDNKLKFQMETILTGWYIFDLVEDDSVWQAYPVGDKAKVNLNWVNDTVSSSQVSGLIDGIVSLKNVANVQGA